MAPEHKLPAPIDDCLSALGWVHENIAGYGGDANRIFVAGWSAGGTLAALSEDDLLIAKWNNLQIARLRIELIDGEYVFVEEENVIVDFGTPVTDVTVAPNGDIYVADWGGGRIFRVSP